MPITWTDNQVGYISLLGSRFPCKEKGYHVFSCFPSSLNIMDGEGNLFTLVAHQRQLHPRSALVVKNARIDPFFSIVRPKNERVWVNPMGIFFQGGQWVSLLKAKQMPPKCEAPPFGISIDWPKLLGRTDLLDLLQKGQDSELTVSNLLGKTAAKTKIGTLYFTYVSLLFDGFCHSDGALALQASLGLLGLGPGSTPSGDDFLCGFLLALHLLQNSNQFQLVEFDQSFLSQYEESLKQLLHVKNPTTAISKQFLTLGCEGLFSQSLVLLAKSFVYPQTNDNQFIASLNILAKMGHSSGYDTTTGLLFGLLLFMPESEHRRNIHALPVFLYGSRNDRGNTCSAI
jgi:hypothetical protein